MKLFFLFFLFIVFYLFSYLFSYSQRTTALVSKWRAVIHRQDENNIIFNFEQNENNKKPVLYILNAGERLRVDSVIFTDDSVFIKMPVFESSFKAKTTDSTCNGIWIRGTSGAEQAMPFTAEKNNRRFSLTDGPAKMNINGRWAVRFASDKESEASSIAEFTQKGNRLEGTFITLTGDYR